MSACCAKGCVSGKQSVDKKYRLVLWMALFVNAAMLGVELTAGWRADAVSLLVDALDFLGNAAHYGISLYVLVWCPSGAFGSPW
jgi:Co/Zn/Cd efflux system component